MLPGIIFKRLLEGVNYEKYFYKFVKINRVFYGRGEVAFVAERSLTMRAVTRVQVGAADGCKGEYRGDSR